MGKRPRLIGILTVWLSSVGGGVGDAFGFCAETDNVAATIMQAAAKDLKIKPVGPVDMLSDYSSGAVPSLLDDAGSRLLALLLLPLVATERSQLGSGAGVRAHYRMLRRLGKSRHAC